MTIRTLLRAAAGFVLALSASAQSLTITEPGYSAVKLFDATAGFTIAGLAASPGGDVFYLETDSAFTANTRLFRRSAIDGYTTPTLLFDFGAFKFGSFVVFHGSRVFFGENSTGVIRSIAPDGTGLDELGVVPGNYDLAFSGGSLYLSHNPGGFTPQNKVTKFSLAGLPGDLTLAAATLIIDTPMDYSGPIEFGPGGALFYGGTGSFAMPDLYRFAAAEVDGSGPVLQLDAPHLYLPNGTNAFLAYDGAASLWHSNYGTLNLINALTPSVTTIGSATGSINHLDYAGGALFANVTNVSFDRSAVFIVVPEPGSAALLLAGLALCARRRR